MSILCVDLIWNDPMMFSGRGPGNFTADVSWCGDLTTVMHTCFLWYMGYATVVDSELKHVMGHIIMAHPLQVKGLIKVSTEASSGKMKTSRDIFFLSSCVIY